MTAVILAIGLTLALGSWTGPSTAATKIVATACVVSTLGCSPFSVSGRINPVALPSSTRAPFTLTLRGSSPDVKSGYEVPVPEEIELDLDRKVGIDTSKLRVSQQVGGGQLYVRTASRARRSEPVRIYLAGRRGATIYLQLEAPMPPGPALIRRFRMDPVDSEGFGVRARLVMPRPPVGVERFEAFEAHVGHGLLTARCPRGALHARAIETTAAGGPYVEEPSLPCTPKD